MSVRRGLLRARDPRVVVSVFSLALSACGSVKLAMGETPGDPTGTEPVGASTSASAGDEAIAASVPGPPASVARFDLPPDCSMKLGHLRFTNSDADASTFTFEAGGTGSCKWNGVNAYDCSWDSPESGLGPADGGLMQLWAQYDGILVRWGSGRAYTESSNCAQGTHVGTTATTSNSSGSRKRLGESCSTAANDCESELRCLEQKSGSATSGTKCAPAAGSKCAASSDCNSAKLSCSSYVCK